MIMTLALLPLVPVPESGPTFILLAIAFVSLILLHRGLTIRKLRTATARKGTATTLAIIAFFVFAGSALAGPAPVPAQVPEAGPTLLLLGLALIAVIGLRFKLAK
jgi:hypothetical protein